MFQIGMTSPGNDTKSGIGSTHSDFCPDPNRATAPLWATVWWWKQENRRKSESQAKKCKWVDQIRNLRGSPCFFRYQTMHSYASGRVISFPNAPICKSRMTIWSSTFTAMFFVDWEIWPAILQWARKWWKLLSLGLISDWWPNWNIKMGPISVLILQPVMASLSDC